MSTNIDDSGTNQIPVDDDLIDMNDSFFEESDVEHDKLTGKDMDITDILARIRDTGGVNQDVAIQMESLEPGILESKFLTTRHYTQGYSRTNLKVSQEALEDMSQGAKIALAVGVGAFVAGLVAWILSKVFGEDEDSGGGGGGGSGGSGIKDRNLDERKKSVVEDYKYTDTILKDIAETERDMQKKLQAKAEELGWNKLMNEVGASGKSFTISNGIDLIYRKHLKKHYSPLLQDLVSKPTAHVSLAHHLVTNIPKWIRELASLQNQLFHKEKGKVDPAKYKLVYTLPQGLPVSDSKLATLLAHYRQYSEPKNDLPFPEFTHIEHANFLESTIKVLDANQGHLLKDMENELDAYLEVIKSSPDELANKLDATNALRNAYREIGMAYQVLVLMTNKCDQFLKDLEIARTEKDSFLTKTCAEMVKESETEEQKSAWKTFSDKVKSMVNRKPK